MSVREKTRYPGLYRRGQRFQFRVTRDGKQTWVSTPVCGVQEALSFRARYLGQGAPLPAREKLEVAFPDWLEERDLKPRVRMLYEIQWRNHLSPALGHRRVGEIGPEDIRRLINALTAKGLAAGSVRNVLIPLSAFYSTQVAHRRVEHNPVKLLERGTRPRSSRKQKIVLTPAQAQSLMASVTGPWRVHVALGLLAGLRQSEALGLSWEDVSDTHLHVRQQASRDGDLVSLKGREGDDKTRRVELSNTLRRILLEWRLETGGRSGLVLHTRTGRPLDQRNATRAFHEAREDAGLPEALTFHQLRHTFASALIADGADVTFVSHQLGHSSPSITMDIYAHEFKAARESGSAARAIDRIFGEALA